MWLKAFSILSSVIFVVSDYTQFTSLFLPYHGHRASAQPTRASIQRYWTMFHKNVYMYKPPKMAATQLFSNRTQTYSD